MFDRLTSALRETEAALAELDPAGMIGIQPARGLELVGRHERTVAAARLKLTARAAAMNHWQTGRERIGCGVAAAPDGAPTGTDSGP